MGTSRNNIIFRIVVHSHTSSLIEQDEGVREHHKNVLNRLLELKSTMNNALSSCVHVHCDSIIRRSDELIERDVRSDDLLAFKAFFLQNYSRDRCIESDGQVFRNDLWFDVNDGNGTRLLPMSNLFYRLAMEFVMREIMEETNEYWFSIGDLVSVCGTDIVGVVIRENTSGIFILSVECITNDVARLKWVGKEGRTFMIQKEKYISFER